MHKGFLTYALSLLFLMVSCTDVSVPSEYESIYSEAPVFPDYSNVTVPPNIAPLNFMVRKADKVVACFNWNGGSACFGRENKVVIPQKQWRRIAQQAKGDSVCVQLYTQQEGRWRRWNDFKIHIALEPIDKYLSYRLIEPSFIAYEVMSINQRDVENFDERVFLRVDQCINCHSYKNYNTDNMLFHTRGEQGGTTFIRNGKTVFLTDLKRDSMISNPVYPSWHPEDDVVAFSTNTTRQIFHTQDNDKVEVQDFASSLVIYDIENDLMIPVPSDTLDMETFPTWSPDGTKLYSCSARYLQKNEAIPYERDMMINYSDVHYGIYVRDYYRATKTLGPRKPLLEMSEGSATLPRVSPDGRYLLFANGPYGCFHIWHHEADINILDLETGCVNIMSEANSTRAESYPTWSSNGRWIVMASRRDDGNYSRVYISYFGTDGKACKAFELPQKDPASNDFLLKSYNRPELTVNKLPSIQ